jgi:hypothetical protein
VEICSALQRLALNFAANNGVGYLPLWLIVRNSAFLDWINNQGQKPYMTDSGRIFNGQKRKQFALPLLSFTVYLCAFNNKLWYPVFALRTKEGLPKYPQING